MALLDGAGLWVVLWFVVSYGGGLPLSLTVAPSLPGPLVESPSISPGPHQALPSCHPLHAPSPQRYWDRSLRSSLHPTSIPAPVCMSTQPSLRDSRVLAPRAQRRIGSPQARRRVRTGRQTMMTLMEHDMRPRDTRKLPREVRGQPRKRQQGVGQAEAPRCWPFTFPGLLKGEGIGDL